MEKQRLQLIAASLLLVSSAAVQAQARGGLAPVASAETDGADGQSTMNTQERASPGSVAAPLSGADVFTPSSGNPGRSYLLPSFEWTGYANTNPTGTGGHSRLATVSDYVGGVTLQRARRHSQLNLQYAGGAFFYSRRLEGGLGTIQTPNGTFQSLGVRQKVNWRRWELEFEDQGQYLPESAFGFTGFTGLNSFGSGLGGNLLSNAPFLNPALEPNQTILTGSARRLSNVAVAQVQYSPGARSTLTATGLYGTLHFLDKGFTDSNYWGVLTGYNHAITRRDTVSVTYAHDLIRLDADHREILNRGFQLLYGHQITGRLSLVISGGPMVTQIALPLGRTVTRSFLNTYDFLQYRLRRWSAEASFLRDVSAGAGVLLGAENDLAQASVNRQFFRGVNMSLRVGHAYNQSLTRESNLQRRFEYEAWRAGFNLSRELQEYFSLYLNYDFEQQVSNNPACLGNNCGRVTVRHVGGIGINWHTRPIKIG